MLCELLLLFCPFPLPSSNPLYTLPPRLHRAPLLSKTKQKDVPTILATIPVRRPPHRLARRFCCSRFTPTSLPAPPTNHVPARRQRQNILRAHEPHGRLVGARRRVQACSQWAARVLGWKSRRRGGFGARLGNEGRWRHNGWVGRLLSGEGWRAGFRCWDAKNSTPTRLTT